MVTVSNDYIYINGVRCDTAVGLSCDTPPIPAMAVQDYTEWKTGADSPKSSPDGTFNSVQYNLTARVFLGDSPHDNSDVYAYFADARTLTLSRLPDYYFKVLKVNGIQPTVQHDGKVIVYRIGLTLAPFRYHVDNQEVEMTAPSITNPGNRYSRPLYKIKNRTAGLTTVTLTVNGQQFVLSGLTDSNAVIYIDADKMLCYSKANESATATTNLIPKSTGQIPFLAPGVNAAAVNNGTLYITGNWRSY